MRIYNIFLNFRLKKLDGDEKCTYSSSSGLRIVHLINYFM